MEDIRDLLIYVVIMAIGLIGNVIRNHRKKQEEQRRLEQGGHLQEEEYEESASKMPPSPWDAIFGEEVLPEPQAMEEAVPESIEVEEPDLIRKEGYAAFESTSVAMEEDKLDESEIVSDRNFFEMEDDVEEEEFEFDPQKAIIYSEILKRPEY